MFIQQGLILEICFYPVVILEFFQMVVLMKVSLAHPLRIKNI